jgi:serine phosphatase RsbU (regulator of sigma subunit)
MALCRTLIRSFAKDYARRPDLVISECNERPLEDARDALFVTAFYGVLDINTNEFTYTNAGHNPPCIIGEGPEAKPKALPLTGLPIGIDKEEEWTAEQIDIEKGELIVIYSDGIPDAQNAAQEAFGDARIMDFIQKNRNKGAAQFQDSLLREIEKFSEDAKQFDDMTLLVLKRENDASKKPQKLLRLF